MSIEFVDSEGKVIFVQCDKDKQPVPIEKLENIEDSEDKESPKDEEEEEDAV